MGYQVVRQPLWIEGKQIQPGVKVLSGPFDLSQISSHVTPATTPSNNDPLYSARLVDLPETPDSVWEDKVPMYVLHTAQPWQWNLNRRRHVFLRMSF